MNIPSMVDGNTALVGLVGATGRIISYPLYIDSFVYTVNSAPSAPSLSTYTTTTAGGANGNYAATPTFSPSPGTRIRAPGKRNPFKKQYPGQQHLLHYGDVFNQHHPDAMAEQRGWLHCGNVVLGCYLGHIHSNHLCGRWHNLYWGPQCSYLGSLHHRRFAGERANLFSRSRNLPGNTKRDRLYDFLGSDHLHQHHRQSGNQRLN